MNIKEVLFVIITTIHFTFGFIAYDCGGPNLNITSFDSLEVDNCDLPIPSKTERVTRIQLLQRVETYPVNFKSCLITVDYLITRCSAFEDAQVVEGGYFSDIIELGSARCSPETIFHFSNGRSSDRFKNKRNDICNKYHCRTIRQVW